MHIYTRMYTRCNFYTSLLNKFDLRRFHKNIFKVKAMGQMKVNVTFRITLCFVILLSWNFSELIRSLGLQSHQVEENRGIFMTEIIIFFVYGHRHVKILVSLNNSLRKFDDDWMTPAQHNWRCDQLF